VGSVSFSGTAIIKLFNASIEWAVAEKPYDLMKTDTIIPKAYEVL
jgi:hypothetical protein